MRRLSGYVTITDPDRPLREIDTASCCHCGAIIFVKPGTASTVYLILDPATGRSKEEPGASCWHCMKPVCLACHDQGVCLPLERQLANWERAACR